MTQSRLTTVRYRVVFFVDPEVASVGISEADARAKGIKPKIGITPISIIGRANTSDRSTGFVKIICDQKHKIIGACIVAPRAGEMIHELGLAIQLGATSDDIAHTIHAFPTWNEAVRIAAGKVS